jgi:hypothetical protein
MNRLYQNPELARARWNQFSRELGRQLGQMMARPETPISPIFEAIQATALRTFNRPDYSGASRRLIIVSDLLQNMPNKLNQYEGTPPFSDFKRTPYFSQVRADLTDVTVTLLYLVRPHTAQKWPDHYQFWEQYFQSQGATVDRLEPVYGAR